MKRQNRKREKLLFSKFLIFFLWLLYAHIEFNKSQTLKKQIDLTPTWLTVYPVEVWQQPLAGPCISTSWQFNWMTRFCGACVRQFCVREWENRKGFCSVRCVWAKMFFVFSYGTLSEQCAHVAYRHKTFSDDKDFPLRKIRFTCFHFVDIKSSASTECLSFSFSLFQFLFSYRLLFFVYTSFSERTTKKKSFFLFGKHSILNII